MTLFPVTRSERIESLDVVRGFALLGIFLMNIEFFNRSLMGIGEGMPPGLTGVDWFASWFVAYFIQGKFWTIFSLLFGMGFAVMLARAERAERAFMRPYLRRIVGLAVIGALHYLFVWQGDILFSYALAAGGLLVLLYAKWKRVVLALLSLIALAFVPGLGKAGQIAGSLAFIGLVAIYLRSEKRIKIGPVRIPLFAFIYLALGTLGAVVSTVLWVLPDAPEDARLPVTIVTAFILLTAYLSGRYHDPVERRPPRLGLAIFIVPTLMVSAMGAVQYLSPPDPDDAIVAQMAGLPAPTDVAIVPPTAPLDDDAKQKRIERVEQLTEHLERKRTEERVLTSGTYREVVWWRAKQFPERIANDSGLAVFAIGLFLIGFWFVRSGVMENASAHLRLFRRLAWYGLPLGIGIGLLGSLIATSYDPASSTDGFQLARGLAMLGSLPACLGYIGLIVVALHGNTAFGRSLRVLAPAGRMALTNYVMQSVISTLVFYGYAGAQWGLARSWQIVFVLGVFALQVAASHWWLARFRYGPLEWIWRAFTYREIPPMRL